MNTEGPEGDKRTAPRQRTLKGAKIAFKNGAFTYECRVRNLSATGAQLQVAATDGIPKPVPTRVRRPLTHTNLQRGVAIRE
jgi:hypothetical protein